jgi:hypothetical protein
MVRSLSFIVVAFLTLSIGYAQGITGKWKGQMQTPNGPMDLVFNFKAIGDSLAGTVEGPMGEMPVANGKITGKMFTFDVNANDMTISHQCTAMGDSISMKIPGFAGGEAMELMLRRVTEGQKQSK